MNKLFSVVWILGVFVITASADVFTTVQEMRKGVNLGNWMEAPNYNWGVDLDSTDIERIAEAGFQTIRVPIRWETRSDSLPPYAIEESFFAEVDDVIRWGRENQLYVVIDLHHHEALYEEPEDQKDRFMAMWSQISRRYQNESDSLLFEILNEPHGNLSAALWNDYLAEALDTIRLTNLDRAVVIGTAEYGGIGGMSKLEIPNDPNLIFTVHYYEPFSFTHQGAGWVDPVPPVGVTWEGNYFELLDMKNSFDYVARWAAERNIPVFVGEFGAYSTADTISRALWTEAVARLSESHGFAWAYWEYNSGYGVWNEGQDRWNQYLLDALMSTDTTILEMDPEELGENQLRNGEFTEGSNGDQYWSFADHGDSAEATGGVVDGVYEVVVIKPGEVNYDIQLKNTLDSVVAGQQYVLMFDAKADTNRGLATAIQNQTDWTYYGGGSYGLTEDWTTFVQSFTLGENIENEVGVVFNIGAESGTVYIDNVKVVKVGEPVSALEPFAKDARSTGLNQSTQMYLAQPGSMLQIHSATTGFKSLSFFRADGRLFLQKNQFLQQGENLIEVPQGQGLLLLQVE